MITKQKSHGAFGAENVPVLHAPTRAAELANSAEVCNAPKSMAIARDHQKSFQSIHVQTRSKKNKGSSAKPAEMNATLVLVASKPNQRKRSVRKKS